MRDNLSALKTKLASLMSGSGSGSILPGQTKEEAAAKTQQAFAAVSTRALA